MKFKISENRLLSETIRYLKVAPLSQFNFYPGQYVQLVLNEKELLPFTIANAPNAQGYLEFLIRENDEDPMLKRLKTYLSKNEIIHIMGAYGHVVYQPVPNKTIIFLAGGIGISQVKAILEQALIFKDMRAFHLYWGMADRRDFVLREQLQEWETKLHFNYKIIFTRPVINLTKRESIGLPYQAIAEDFPDMSHCQVYSCGPWEMTDKALAIFLQQHLPREAMLSDRFAFN